jgi:hypothetical protein
MKIRPNAEWLVNQEFTIYGRTSAISPACPANVPQWQKQAQNLFFGTFCVA